MRFARLTERGLGLDTPGTSAVGPTSGPRSASRVRQEPRYTIVVKTDEYTLGTAIFDLAVAALGRDSDVSWEVRDDA